MQFFIRFAVVLALVVGCGGQGVAQETARAPVPPAAQACDPSAFHDGKFDTGEIEIAYTEGPKAGPTILFLPGMGVPRQSYATVARLLCDRFHVVMIDQRGHGESSWAKDHSYRVTDYGRDLVAFIKGALHGEPVIISGHSLGGLVALWLAAEHPELTAGLNAEDNPFLMSERGRWETHWVKPMFEATERRLRSFQASNRDPATLRSAFAAEQMTLPRQNVPYVQRVRAMGKLLSNMDGRRIPEPDSVEANRIERAVQNWLAGVPVTNGEFFPNASLQRIAMASAAMDPDVAHAAVTAELNDGFNHRAAMAKVIAPVLYWNSDQDLVGVISQAEHDENVRVIGEHARIRHVVTPGVGHLIHAEVPELYTSEILRFFVGK